MNRCKAITCLGNQCKNKTNDEYCYIHIPIECSICMNNICSKIVLKNCKHTFCKNCIYEWLIHNSTCPLCRTNADTTEIVNSLCYGISNEKIFEVREYIYHLGSLNYDDYNIFVNSCNNFQFNIWFSPESWYSFLSEINENEILFNIFKKIHVTMNTTFQLYIPEIYGEYNKEMRLHFLLN